MWPAPRAHRGEISRFSAEKAMEHVKAQVAFGPRPPGSEALKKTREYLLRELESYGFKVEQDAFSADTPYGVKPMVNLIARKGPTGGSRDVIALASHYDGKLMEGNNFVAANDGGSSTGLLLELARVLHGRDSGADYWFVFLDGEEAFVRVEHLRQHLRKPSPCPTLEAAKALSHASRRSCCST